MDDLQPGTVLAAVIGDLVGSRASADRLALHRRLDEALARANEELRPVVPLRITVGDEFQGCFREVGQALRATLWLRLALLPEADLRHGVAWGPVTVLAEDPRVEDGPGWWAARDAIEEVAAEGAKAQRHLRTAYHRVEGVPGPDPAAVRAALICRDHLVGSVAMVTSGRPLRLLTGALAGRTQAELAEQEGISASAVSQRFRNDGVAAIVAADRALGEVR